MCYDTNDTNAPVSGADPSQTERGQVVVDPATAVLGGFAGVVNSKPLKDANGTVIPSWIDIILPRKGDIIDLWTNASVTKNSTILGITNSGGVNFVSVSDATFNVDAVAIVLQTVDRSGTAGLARCKFI